MSQLIYNGIELSYWSTQSVDFSPVYSDDGNGDLLYTKITISGNAVVNSLLAPQLPGESATQIMARVNHKLLQPRKSLIFQVGPDKLIETQPPGTTDVLDAKNGPLPQHCRITRISGSTTFLVDYSVITHIVDCPENTGQLNYVSHRYSDSVTIDELFYTTRTRTGKIIARSDMLTNADSLRGVVATGTLPPGFKRMSSTYVLSDDGLTMQYTFVDREVYLQPPFPAVRAEGSYTESSSSPGGIIRFAECNVKLYGAKGTTGDARYQGDKGLMMRSAIIIALTKIKGNNPQGIADVGFPTDCMLTGIVIRENMYENEIEISIKVQLGAGDKTRTLQVPFDLRKFTNFPFGSDPATNVIPPDPGTRGTAGLALVAQALRDPCLSTSTLSTGKQSSTSTLTNAFPPAQVFMTAVFPTDQAKKVKTDTTGIMKNYGLRSNYKMKNFMRHLPLATANPNYAGSAMIQTAAPLVSCLTHWSAEKMGTSPPVPAANAVQDTNSVLTHFEITADAVELGVDGVSLIFKREGIYVHGFKDPTKVQIEGGLMPWIDLPNTLQTRVPPEDFRTGIIGPTVNPTGSSIFTRGNVGVMYST